MVWVRPERWLEQACHGCRYDEFDVADRLRQRGWVVPAYTMAPGAEVSAESSSSPLSAAFPDIPYADLPDAKSHLRPQCTALRLACNRQQGGSEVIMTVCKYLCVSCTLCSTSP